MAKGSGMGKGKGPYHDSSAVAWVRALVAQGEGALAIEMGAESEGKGTDTGKGKVEKGADNEGKGTDTGKGKGMGKYSWDAFLEDERVLFELLEQYHWQACDAGRMARLIIPVLFTYKGKARGKGMGKSNNDEGADDTNDEGDEALYPGPLINAAREGQTQREEPPPPIALPYVPPSLRRVI